MNLTSTLIHSIDRLTQTVGNTICFLTLVIMLLQCLTLILNLATVNATALQEATLYCHSCLFLLAMGLNLHKDEHVRVDVFYRTRSKAFKAWVNSLGSVLFTLPVAIFIFAISMNFVSLSWEIGEVSPEPGGLPTVFLLKTLIPVMAVLLALQAFAECLRNVQLLGGNA